MIDERIRERAKDACEAFRAERDRVHGKHMKAVLNLLAGIAENVWDGEYHRDAIFGRLLDRLKLLGFDVSDADPKPRPPSKSVEEAAFNAQRDTCDLWEIVRDPHSSDTRETVAVRDVVSMADDVMGAIVTPSLDMGFHVNRLHEAVNGYIEAVDSKGDDRDAEVGKLRAHRECGNCRYYFPGPVIGRERCVMTAWMGADDVFVSPDQPGCERWRRNRASDFEE